VGRRGRVGTGGTADGARRDRLGWSWFVSLFRCRILEEEVELETAFDTSDECLGHTNWETHYERLSIGFR
jgi:hypothetical protein